MDEFSKTQLVLLGVFISFVTSMITGVVVVSLMRQEPQGVVQTINRVVEHTIEKVIAPAEKEIITEKEVITKEVTTEVIIKEGDLVALAVEKGLKGIFSLHSKGLVGTEATVLGSGFVVDSLGTMVTDARIFPASLKDEERSELYNNLYVEYNGHIIPVSVVGHDENNDISILKPITDTNVTNESDEGIVYVPLTFADESALKLGQLVIALDATGYGNVRRGIISSLDVGILADVVTEDIIGKINYILTDISFEVTGAGGPLLSLDGEVVGLNSIDAGSGIVRAVPAEKIIAFIEKLKIDIVSESLEDSSI